MLRFALYLVVPLGSWLGGAFVERLLAAADAAAPDPNPPDAREMALEEAGYFLERLAAMRRRLASPRS
jgi:hypothetical protein